MKKIRIHSDGTGSDTVILDEDGVRLEHIRSATVHMNAGEVNEAELELVQVSVNALATVTEVTYHCPCCGIRFIHNCATQLGGDPVPSTPVQANDPQSPFQPGQVVALPLRPISLTHPICNLTDTTISHVRRCILPKDHWTTHMDDNGGTWNNISRVAGADRCSQFSPGCPTYPANVNRTPYQCVFDNATAHQTHIDTHWNYW